MKDLIDKKVLVTTSNWFFGPDGLQYRAVWGTLNGVYEAGKTMGFIPNRAHANWYIQVGGLIIMGCQAMYVLQCDNPPPSESIKDWKTIEATAEIKEYTRPSQILILN